MEGLLARPFIVFFFCLTSTQERFAFCLRLSPLMLESGEIIELKTGGKVKISHSFQTVLIAAPFSTLKVAMKWNEHQT